LKNKNNFNALECLFSKILPNRLKIRECLEICKGFLAKRVAKKIEDIKVFFIICHEISYLPLFGIEGGTN